MHRRYHQGCRVLLLYLSHGPSDAALSSSRRRSPLPSAVHVTTSSHRACRAMHPSFYTTWSSIVKTSSPRLQNASLRFTSEGRHRKTGQQLASYAGCASSESRLFMGDLPSCFNTQWPAGRVRGRRKRSVGKGVPRSCPVSRRSSFVGGTGPSSGLRVVVGVDKFPVSFQSISAPFKSLGRPH
ncbi:hypothetical protein B0T11DRAFT_49150 [Plectosphaerella cucumerina]|jgi:hypothetical protein|uniref:Uncharacterized protein n=1 Tax=Plectosphaerella cucumerina TaxID=40658 RepID=A0A8K0X6I9_9PEZI|nr:hypothetical protein B0T11DRAFT_49150 [Plectosphaerella cucumerina]